MKKSIISVIAALASCSLVAASSDASDMSVSISYGGATFTGARIGYRAPSSKTGAAYGADAHYFYQQVGDSVQQTYLIYPYVAFDAFSGGAYSAQWLVGLGLAKAYYEAGESDFTIAPGAGIAVSKEVGSGYTLKARGVGLLYRDGLSCPAEFSLQYTLNERFALNAGVGVLISFLWETKTELFLRGGVLLGASYKF